MLSVTRNVLRNVKNRMLSKMVPSHKVLLSIDCFIVSKTDSAFQHVYFVFIDFLIPSLKPRLLSYLMLCHSMTVSLWQQAETPKDLVLLCVLYQLLSLCRHDYPTHYREIKPHAPTWPQSYVVSIIGNALVSRLNREKRILHAKSVERNNIESCLWGKIICELKLNDQNKWSKNRCRMRLDKTIPVIYMNGEDVKDVCVSLWRSSH